MIDNKMEKDVHSAKCEFIPAMDYYLEGYIAAKRGTASNLGVRVIQRPTSIRFTYYVAKEGAANQGAIVAGEPMPSGVPAADQMVSVTADVPLVEPKTNEANIPEYHLEIQSDGTVRQIDLPKKQSPAPVAHHALQALTAEPGVLGLWLTPGATPFPPRPQKAVLPPRR